MIWKLGRIQSFVSLLQNRNHPSIKEFLIQFESQFLAFLRMLIKNRRFYHYFLWNYLWKCFGVIKKKLSQYEKYEIIPSQINSPKNIFPLYVLENCFIPIKRKFLSKKIKFWTFSAFSESLFHTVQFFTETKFSLKFLLYEILLKFWNFSNQIRSKENIEI